MFSLLERINNYYPQAKFGLFCREYLRDHLRENKRNVVDKFNEDADDGCLFINGRLLMQSPILLDGEEEIGIKGETVVYARLKKENCKGITPELFLKDNGREIFKRMAKIKETEAILINYFWDLIVQNNILIEKDFREYIKTGAIKGELYDGVYLVNSGNIFVGEGTRIKPGCVLDAEEGTIYIGRNVLISSNSTIEGPAFIGDETRIQPHSRIRAGSNIGELCKIGGEIEHSIIHDFSNKQHDGFLGHAYIGSWVNLGADTVNSNLKNTYGKVNVKLGGDIVNTEQMFLGIAIGDHTKSAINTTFMTGSIIGFGSNIVTSRFPPKFVPSFSWCLDKWIMPQDIDSVIETAENVMARRNKRLSRVERALFKTIYELTEDERKTYPRSGGKRYKTDMAY